MQTKIHVLPKSHPVYDDINHKAVFIDIETTGLSPKYHQIFLISMIYFADHQWNLVQCFADKIEEEKEVLFCIFAFFKDKSVIISYNGNRFDLPFIKKRADQLGVKCDFSKYESLDLYEKMRHYQFIHGMEKLTLPKVQRELGIDRKDIYRGVDCVAFYNEYQQNPTEELLNLLLLHNYEDVYTLPHLYLEMMHWKQYATFHIEDEKFEIISISQIDDFLQITLHVHRKLISGVYYMDTSEIHVEANKITVLLPITSGFYDEDTTCSFIVKNNLPEDLYEFSRFNHHEFPEALIPISKGKKYYLDNLIELLKIELNHIVKENSCESSE